MRAPAIPVLFWLLASCTPKESVAPDAITATHDPVVATDAADADAAKIPRVSDDPVIQSIVDLGHKDPKVAEHLAYLVETIGPRLTSSHALMEAEQWTRAQFESWGLSARLETWGTFPVGFDRGAWSGTRVDTKGETVGDPLDFITMSWTPGVSGPQRGKLRPYPESAAAAKKQAKDYAGAWVFVTGEQRNGDEKKNDAIDDALRKAGVAGWVFASRDPSQELVHTSGDHEIEWDELPTDVRIHLRGDQHAQLLEMAKGGSEVELAFSIDNSFFRGPVEQHNVIADIRGSEKPDEYVIVGGHLDSWDGARGAVDNGTGVATTMEAARLLMAAGAQPKRTIRFMLWTGEEQGLFGSEKYVAAHPELMEKISAVLVHDGGTNFLSGLAVTPEMLAMAKGLFEPLTRLDDRFPFRLELAESLQPGGSDHSPFIAAGVPGFFWLQDGRADYDHAHHTQFDTMEAVVPEYQDHSAMVVAISALQLANAEEMLPRENSAPLPPRRVGVKFGPGLTVKEILPDGAAKRAGIKKGDKFLYLEGHEDTKTWEMFLILQSGDPKKTVVVERNGKPVKLEFDYSQDEGEAQRVERRKARQATFGELEYGTTVFGTAYEAPKPEAADDDRAADDQAAAE